VVHCTVLLCCYYCYITLLLQLVTHDMGNCNITSVRVPRRLESGSVGEFHRASRVVFLWPNLGLAELWCCLIVVAMRTPVVLGGKKATDVWSWNWNGAFWCIVKCCFSLKVQSLTTARNWFFRYFLITVNQLGLSL